MRRAVMAAVAAVAVGAAVATGIVIAAPGAGAAASFPTVRRGDTGANVYAVQHLLTAHGRRTTADGDFGPATESSVRSFQSASSIGVDGIVGNQTWPKLIMTVRRGSNGEAVKAAQRLLDKFGSGLSVDGDFGPATDAATRRFQSGHQLAVDGIVGPNTWAALLGGSGSGGGGGGGGGGTGTYRLILAHNALPRSEYDDPHHDYPAIDLPVGTGTDAFAVTAGTIHYVGGDCGRGVQLLGTDGVTYTYCHFSARRVADGARVAPGQFIGDTGATGHATGPHLHFQIRSGGVLRCPQRLLLALFDGRTPPNPRTLPTSGCSY
jgi:peptidoglycan hydrolase-like protein with peptidoglycan-binding domain